MQLGEAWTPIWPLDGRPGIRINLAVRPARGKVGQLLCALFWVENIVEVRFLHRQLQTMITPAGRINVGPAAGLSI